nr:cytochrome c [Gammaproteobacteria bacterium]
GFKAFQNENGYVANELTGLWLKGPYLHNGSVPTLRDLLRPPAERPKTFWRGYDLVDAENGGFVAADDPAKGIFVSRYSWLVDTSVPGNGNGGHAWGTDLEDIKKEDLLSYLKTL